DNHPGAATGRRQAGALGARRLALGFIELVLDVALVVALLLLLDPHHQVLSLAGVMLAGGAAFLGAAAAGVVTAAAVGMFVGEELEAAEQRALGDAEVLAGFAVDARGFFAGGLLADADLLERGLTTPGFGAACGGDRGGDNHGRRDCRRGGGRARARGGSVAGR